MSATKIGAEFDCYTEFAPYLRSFWPLNHRGTAAMTMQRIMLAGVLAAVAATAHAETLDGRVIAVLDGDTITLLDVAHQQYRIRLAEIDAPERAQAFGQAAKESLAGLCFERMARAECPTSDRYGRQVCTVVVDGLDVNAEQVERGLAWVYRQYASDTSPLYAREGQARQAGRGLWQERNPTPPWEWRHARK